MDLERVREELQKGKALLIDVREPSEWNESHLEYSVLFPLSELPENANSIPKDIPIYTHCRKGRRAQEAATFLKKTHHDVTPLNYDFEDLKKAGL